MTIDLIATRQAIDDRGYGTPKETRALIDEIGRLTRYLQLDVLQREQFEWSIRNFGVQEWMDSWLGVVEEVGELSHALLKQKQGIRGTSDEHESGAKDAIGDIVVFLAGLCNARGWDLAQCVTDVWTEVKQRDWTSKAEGHDGTK